MTAVALDFLARGSEALRSGLRSQLPICDHGAALYSMSAVAGDRSTSLLLNLRMPEGFSTAFRDWLGALGWDVLDRLERVSAASPRRTHAVHAWTVGFGRHLRSSMAGGWRIADE